MADKKIDWCARDEYGQRVGARVVTPDGFHGRTSGGPGAGGMTSVKVDAPQGGHTMHTYRTEDLRAE